MHSKITYKAKFIRFRRWSRAGYAIFCSLACSVSIGSLAISISDKSLQKSVDTTSVRLIQTNSESEESDLDGLDEVLQNNQEVLVKSMVVDSAAACSQISLYILFIIAVKMGLSCFNRFFICSL